ncbi:hypothetical protein BJY04DRAFT_184569 [Aspergillus karnatakaensis]|uniref:uncharacterized protein n=1 Tax=Aspergillus karnatakaensis TaxID=1810916 RepID=UPI003CCCD3A4
MSGVELALGLIGAADVCFRAGRTLVETYKAIQIADTDVSEKVVTIEAIWIKISFQLGFLQRIWDSLDQSYRDLQEAILPILHRKLEAAILHISKAQKKYRPDGEILRGLLPRSKYVVFVKGSLEQAIRELRDWQGTFDSTWYLMTTYLTGHLDNDLNKVQTDTILALQADARGSNAGLALGLPDMVGLRQTSASLRAAIQEPTEKQKMGVFLPPDRLLAAQCSTLPFSTTQLIQDLGPTLPSCILDSAECAPDTDSNILTKDVRTLASRLQTVPPLEFHLLNCFGVVRMKDPVTQMVKSFNFIFRIPQGLTNPKSLREHLLFLTKEYSLTSKVRLAKQLARAVSFVHTLGFVHKNIRPETIMIFEDSTRPESKTLFLTGFKFFRMEDGRTLLRGDAAWETNLYRHPARQWLRPEADYKMQHDIYSLGVCLLEIGLGSSFVNYTGHDVSSDQRTEYHSGLFDLQCIKSRLCDLAEQNLPQKMGEIYTRIVLNCLTCTDADNEDFRDGTQFQDQDGVLVGVAYIEKILLQLDTISI